MATDVTERPLCILLFSGKRKSGKDYITELLRDRIGREKCVIVKISAPIKSHWAESCGLDLSELLSSSVYKENYRQQMIKWGESVREKDYGYFCQTALKMFKAGEKPVWIISDVRRKTDRKWFCENYADDSVRNVRVIADNYVREQRGWTFTTGVDDVASECDLDCVTDWHWQITNNGISDELEIGIQPVLEWVSKHLSRG